MATLIQIRRDSQANWISNNPVLAVGEMAYSTDEQKLKVGDGSSDWSSLSYINALPSEITSEISSAIDSIVDAAPGTLDTLNELAAAINDDASFYTTITNSISSSIDALDTDDIEEGLANLYFTDQRALDATAAAYDVAGSASAAQAAAQTYTDGEISTLDASLKTYADTAESDAITSANSYTDGEISTVNTTISNLDTDNISEGSNLYFTNTRAQDATPGRVVADSTKPGSPSNGDGWLDISTGFLYVYLNDGDSSQWVQV